MRSRRFLFIANTDWYIYRFRRELIRALIARGNEVFVLAPVGDHSEKMKREGVKWVDLKLSRKSLNPVGELFTMLRMAHLYRKIRPEIAHHFTIKCNFYGAIAAYLTRNIPIRIFSITGLGPIFSNRLSFAQRIALHAFVFLFPKITRDAKKNRFIFQNADDRNAYIEKKLVQPEAARLIRGSGIDCDRFALEPIAEDLFFPEARLLFIGRLIREKGLLTLLSAFDLLRARGVRAKLTIAGSEDPGNPYSLSTELAAYRGREDIEWLGHVESIQDVIRKAAIVILPSDREGIPRTLLEAGSMGRVLIASDVPGCREVVLHRKTGLLFPQRDASALADAIESILKDTATARLFGSNASSFIRQEFSDERVIRETLAFYEN